MPSADRSWICSFAPVGLPVLLLLLLAAVSAPSAADVTTPISCYTCKRSESSCKDSFESMGMETVNCTSGTCAKVKNVDDGKTVVRGCGTGLDYGCLYFVYTSDQYTYTSAEMCECSGDLCNTASSLSGRQAVAAAAFAVALLVALGAAADIRRSNAL